MLPASGDLAFDIDDLVRNFSALLVPSLDLVPCGDIASFHGRFFAGNHKRGLRYLVLAIVM